MVNGECFDKLILRQAQYDIEGEQPCHIELVEMWQGCSLTAGKRNLLNKAVILSIANDKHPILLN